MVLGYCHQGRSAEQDVLFTRRFLLEPLCIFHSGGKLRPSCISRIRVLPIGTTPLVLHIIQLETPQIDFSVSFERYAFPVGYAFPVV